MPDYVLTEPAARDIEKIFEHLYRKASPAVAQRVNDRLTLAFEKLARYPTIGHRRFDVKRKELLFDLVFDYAIAFRRDPHVIIVRVLHGAQNLATRL